MVRRPAHRAVEGARAGGSAISRTSTSRRRRCPARPTRSTSRSSVTEKIDRQPARGRRLFERGRHRAERVGVAAEHLRLRQRAGARRQHEPVQPHVLAPVHRAVLHGRRRVAHDRGLPEEPRPDRPRRSRNTRRRRSARRWASACRSPKPTRSTSACRVEHTNITLFSDSPPVYCDFVNEFGASSNAYILTAGWSRDTRDDILYPTPRPSAERAARNRACRSATFRTTSCSTCTQWLLAGVRRLRADAARRTSARATGTAGKPLPFFKAFFAGGVGSVRGYETASLGPQDIFGNALGGRAQDRRQRWRRSTRSSRATSRCARACSPTPARSGSNGDQPEFESFRYSAGVGLAWNSPIGPLKFSYAIPLNAKDGDREQRFQFQAGAAF